MTAKDHAKGNDLASNNPDSNSSPSNPPSESTLNTEIDKLLEAYSYGYTTPTGKIGKDQAKSEIIKLINGANTMTGQEFYQRFEREYHMIADWIAAEELMGDDAEHDVLLAAKRAAGIEEQANHED